MPGNTHKKREDWAPWRGEAPSRLKRKISQSQFRQERNQLVQEENFHLSHNLTSIHRQESVEGCKNRVKEAMRRPVPPRSPSTILTLARVTQLRVYPQRSSDTKCPSSSTSCNSISNIVKSLPSSMFSYNPFSSRNEVMRDVHAIVSGEVHILGNIVNQPYTQCFSYSRSLMYITGSLKIGDTHNKSNCAICVLMWILIILPEKVVTERVRVYRSMGRSKTTSSLRGFYKELHQTHSTISLEPTGQT